MSRPLDLLIIGHNYAPEPVGIGPCTAAMARNLAESGHQVRVICGTPYYPQWKVAEGYRRRWVHRSMEEGVSVLRLPHYVPAAPRTIPRLFHHLSFAALAFLALMFIPPWRRPDVVIAITPSNATTVLARIVAAIWRRPLWIHVQDFEADMAVATGRFRPGGVRRHLVRAAERFALKGDRVSSISPAMCRRLSSKGVPSERIVEFRNWARPEVQPQDTAPLYRARWCVAQPFVALYAGNIAAKQGIDIIMDAARLLDHRHDLLFVVCGEGPNRADLIAAAEDCRNMRFFDLQPAENLSDLLALATVHLLPQIADAADLVLPSKLPNMLASGRPVIATARAGTGLADEVIGCGLVTPPHDAAALSRALERLLDNPALRASLGQAAVRRATERWGKDAILGAFERELSLLVSQRQHSRRWGQARIGAMRGPLTEQETAAQ